MRGLYSLVIILLLALVMVSTDAAKPKKEKPAKGKGSKVANGKECVDWPYGNCIASNGDCGAGFREGTCNGIVKQVDCTVPCNWKKSFGADCKYRFQSWGQCDHGTGTMSRSGTLKKALYKAECQPTIKVSTSCTPKPAKSKTKVKSKRGKGKEN